MPRVLHEIVVAVTTGMRRGALDLSSTPFGKMSKRTK
jgi:hypothetical protein